MTDDVAPSLKHKLDPGFFALLTVILVVTVWLLALPFSKTIQHATLNRFHFQTRSFAVWATQQPIPAMYNLYNRYDIRPSPWDKTPNSIWERGTANHFPLRLFTFGDNRVIFLRPGQIRTIDIRSSYRGESLHTHWTATPKEDGAFDLVGEVVP